MVISEEERPITSRGCIERPEKERFFVTNQDRSAGAWVSPNSAENLKLESLKQVNLPAACNSLVHGNGGGFTLNFDWKDHEGSGGLRLVELSLFPMSGEEALTTWPFRPLEATMSFSFQKDQSLSSGEYRLVSKIKDRVSNVQSKSECILRLDDSQLLVSPADRITDRRNFNEQEVLVVQPGYNLNFYVHEGFRDVKIKYCLQPISVSEIKSQIESSYLHCEKPEDFLNSKTPTLNEGFWVLNYQGHRGQIATSWQHAIFLVEKTCTGIFDSMTSLRGLGCTSIKGNLNLSDLTDLNQRELDVIGRIAGSVTIKNTDIEILDILPNLHDILGDINIEQSERLREIRGLGSLPFVLGDVVISSNPSLQKLSAFSKVQTIAGRFILNYSPILTDVSIFQQLQSVEGTVDVTEVNLNDLSFLSSLQRASSLVLVDMMNLQNLSGLNSLARIKLLQIRGCSKLQSLRGTQLNHMEELDLDKVELASLEGLNQVREVKKLYISQAPKIASLKTGGPPLLVTHLIQIFDDTSLKDLSDVDFSSVLGTVHFQRSNLASLKGLEKVTKAESIQLNDLPALKVLTGLENLRSVFYLDISNTAITDVQLNSLEEVAGDVLLDDNPKLSSLHELKKLKKVEGEFHLGRSDIVNLTSFPDGLSLNDFSLRENNSLLSLQGIERLNEIKGDLVIGSHVSLKTLDGIENARIGGHILIGYSDDSFSQSAVEFDGLPALNDLSALGRINSIPGALRVVSPKCIDEEFVELLRNKVSSKELPADSDPIPEGEVAIMINQPESCRPNHE